VGIYESVVEFLQYFNDAAVNLDVITQLWFSKFTMRDRVPARQKNFVEKVSFERKGSNIDIETVKDFGEPSEIQI